ncbi:MAG: prefoldin subunit alpha [Candidatus Thorarchaeota archaeon]|nr:prefoldin subunit alpha [Candidatus Thorarchaeota archaeon]
MSQQDKQEQLQQLYAQQQMAESNANALQEHIELLQAYLQEYRSGLEVLKKIEDKDAGEDMLMNIGGNIFVRARLLDAETVIREVGSGVRIEQDAQEAKASVEDSLSQLQERSGSLSAQYEKLVTQAQALNTQIRQLVAQMRQPGE